MSAPSFTLSARPCQATGAPAAWRGGLGLGEAGRGSSSERGVQGDTGWSAWRLLPELRAPQGF